MSANLRTRIPAAVRRLITLLLLPTRRTVVLAIQCPGCQTWVPARHFRTPAMLCRTCHAGPTTRTYTRAGHR
jgi:hypothetical protein